MHMVKLAIDGGMPEADASRLLLFLSAGSVSLRVPAAWAADTFGRRRTLSVALALLSVK